MLESMIMKDKEIVTALKNFKKEDMQKLDDIITALINEDQRLKLEGQK